MKISAIGLGVKLDRSLTKIAWPRRNSTRKGEKGLCLYSTDIALIAQSNSFLSIFYTEVHFTVSGKNVALALYRRLQFHGPLAISSKPGGAQGKTLSYDYGDYPGTYYGGKGVFKEGKFRLNKGTVFNIVVGRRGGDSVEVRGGQSTKQTAAQLGKSVEDNASTGRGGGSSVYTADNVLLLAAGGGGGASSGYNGVDGQAGSSGTNSVRKESSQVRKGGTGGQPGEYNSEGGWCVWLWGRRIRG